ncbi:MAG: CoA-binding protein, partial [Bauldia sp.]
SDIQFHEYLDYFAEDENTTVAIVYIEGLQEGRQFIEALRRVALRKPVVIYKSGRTSAGMSSAKSHTGALAGDYAVHEGVLRQAGAVLVRRSDQVLSIAEAMSLLQPLRSRRIAVLADGGGHATIAADLLTEHGLSLASLSADTQKRLAQILPPAAAVANPIDVAGGTDARPALFADCARILIEDDAVDGLLIAGLYGGYGVRFSESLTPDEVETSDRIAALHREFGKPVMVYSLYANLRGELLPAPLTRIRQGGVPVYGSLEVAVGCLAALAEYGEIRRRPVREIGQRAGRVTAFDDILKTCRREGRSVVLEHEARQALAAAGLRLPPAHLARDADAAVAAFEALGRVAVAMKVVSRDIIHKSDAGGVALNVASAGRAREAFASIIAAGEKSVPGARIAGVLVTPMAAKG